MSPLDRCGLGVAEGEQGDVGRQELAGLAWAFFSFFALRFSFNVLAACFLSVLLASCPLGMNLLFVFARCASHSKPAPVSMPRGQAIWAVFSGWSAASITSPTM